MTQISTPQSGPPYATVDSVFPFHLTVDRDLCILRAGMTLQRVLPELTPGRPLLECFAMHSPVQLTFAGIAANLGTTFVLQCISRKLTLKGQMVLSREQDRLFYLCWPWLEDPDGVAMLGLNTEEFLLLAERKSAPTGQEVGRLAELNALGGQELIDELMAEFRIQVESDLKDLQDAAKANDYQELLRLAHRLKGASTTIGMGTVTSLCTDLEIAARGHDQRRIQGVMDRLRAEVEAAYSGKHSQADTLRHVRILIADDHPVVRFGVRRMLQNHAEYMVVGEASDGKEAIREMREMQPDILLLDLNMPLLPGLDTLRELTTSQGPTRTVLLTSAITQRQVLEALQLGARGVVLKDAMASDLAACIDAVMRGHYWLGSKPVSNLVQVLNDLMEEIKQPPQNTFGLTARELEIVRLIAQGLTNKDIARECKIAEETVKRHLKNIFDKVGVWNRLELALFAINNRLVGEVAATV